MDILKTAWIPTDVGTLTPKRTLEEASNIGWARGDWDIATFCLLHALIQTAVVLDPSRCPDRGSWESYRRSPPADLQGWIDFELGGRPWECLSARGEVPVSRLLPETPGDNTIKKSSDIARWQQDVREQLSIAEATIALISDNLWGTRIGTGFYQGARGEQALTTLLEPASRRSSIWERVWLNVMPFDDWQSLQDQASDAVFAFPWNEPIPETPLTPENTHALGVLWQMPRRWNLVQDGDGYVRRVHRQNKGRDYEGWEKLHPLTPYFVKADGTWTAAKISAHTGFDDWASVALLGRSKSTPANVILSCLRAGGFGEQLRIRCCGWALGDAGAAGGWVDHVMPLYVKTVDQADVIENAVIDVDKQYSRLRKALEKVGVNAKHSANQLFNRLETDFYSRVATDSWGPDRLEWQMYAKKIARQLFWDICEAHRIDMLDATEAEVRL